MDPNQPISPQPVQPVTPTQPQPASEQPTILQSSPTPPPTHSSKLWIILSAVALLIILAIGFIYFGGNFKKEPEQKAVDLTEINNLSPEVEGIKIEDEDSEFTEVDVDLSSL